MPDHSPPLQSGGTSEEALSPGGFTDLYLAYLKSHAEGDLDLERVADLEIKVRMKGVEAAHSIFLDNAYQQYLNNTENRDEILETYIGSFIEVTSHPPDRIDPERIVPVIKDRGWIEGIQEGIRQRGGQEDQFPAYVMDLYNSELAIFYAEDSPRNIRYLTEGLVEELGLDRATLRERAIKNLLEIIDGYQVMGGNGLYRLTAGGDYEASLILVDQVWDSGTLEVAGDYVVAIPSRDLLIVTGSEDQESIERVRMLVNERAANLPYSLTPVLFVRRNGAFEVYEG